MFRVIQQAYKYLQYLRFEDKSSTLESPGFHLCEKTPF